jgi:hypothetical protein
MPTLDEIEARVQRTRDEQMPKVTLRMQIQEVEREIALRKNVYPGLVAKHRMRESESAEHQRRMLAVRDTLLAFEAAERKDPDT